MDISVDCRKRTVTDTTSNGETRKLTGGGGSWDDQHLVLAARSGCKVSFNKLWHLYSRRLFRVIIGITRNQQDAEDALQDSFLQAFIALKSFEGRASFYSWLTRIGINSALGVLRKRRAHPETSLDPSSLLEDPVPRDEVMDSAPNPEQICCQDQRREILRQAIQRLPKDLRTAVQVRLTEDYSMKQLACHLNISEASAKSRIFRARLMIGSMTASRYRPCGDVAIPPGR